jgi:CRP/FNR family transcriptional regulator
MDDLEVLKNIFIFRGLGMPALERVGAACAPVTVAKGDYAFWEDDKPEHLFLLKSGKIKLTKQSESGKETILGIIIPGETFGEIAVFDGRPFPFSAQAMEDSQVLKMPRGEFLRFLRETPNAPLEIIIELSRRLRDAQGVIKGMAVERVEHRIIELLLKLAEKVGRRDEAGVRIGILLTRQDIADMVGSTVETTIRVLSRFTKEGWIETRGRSLILKDQDALRAAQEGGDFE